MVRSPSFLFRRPRVARSPPLQLRRGATYQQDTDEMKIGNFETHEDGTVHETDLDARGIAYSQNDARANLVARIHAAYERGEIITGQSLDDWEERPPCGERAEPNELAALIAVASAAHGPLVIPSKPLHDSLTACAEFSAALDALCWRSFASDGRSRRHSQSSSFARRSR